MLRFCWNFSRLSLLGWALLAGSAGADGLPVALQERAEPVRFAEEIAPVLAANCTACHNQKIREGGLALDSLKALLTGGDSGSGVIAGQPDESPIFLRASHRQEDFMPPPDNAVGARALGPEQLGLLQLWIAQGATAGPGAARAPIAWQRVEPASEGVLAVAMNTRGRVTAAARGGSVSLFDTATGALLGSLVDPAAALAGAAPAAHRDAIQALASSGRDDMLATGSFRTVKLWRRQQPARLRDLADSASATSLAVAPTESIAALGFPDGHIALWDLSSGTVLRQARVHQGPVTALVFSGDGGQVYSASVDGTVAALQTAEAAVVGRLKRPGAVGAIAILNGSTQLATADAAGLIQIFALPLSAESQETIQAPLKELSGAAGPIAVLRELPTLSGQLISAGADGGVRLWNTLDGTITRQFAHGGPVAALTMSPDGSRLATVGSIPGGKLWDAASGQLVAEWKGDLREKDRLAAAEIALAVRRQDLEFGKAQVAAAEKDVQTAAADTKQSAEKKAAAEKLLEEKTAAARAADAARTEAEQALAAASTALEPATALQAAAVAGASTAAAAAKRAEEAVAAFTTAAATAADATAAAETLRTIGAAAEATKAAQATADQTVVLAQQQFDRVKARVDELTKKSAEAAKAATEPAKALEQAKIGLTSADRAVEFAAQQTQRTATELPLRQAEAAQAEARVADADATRQQAAEALAATSLPQSAVSFSRDGQWLVSTGAEGCASLLSAASGEPREAWTLEIAGRTLLAETLTGEWIMAGGDSPAQCWSVMPRWIHERTIGGEQTPPAVDDEPTGPPIDLVTALAFSPDGTSLASGSGRPSRSGEIKLWNPADGTLVRDISHPHTDTVTALEFSRAGDRLASGGTDRFVKIHAVADGALIKSLEGHTGHVLGVAWQAHGRQLASAGADTTLKVWNVLAGEQVRTIGGLKKEVTAVRFLPPGEEAVACSGDPTLRLYNVANGSVVREFANPGDFVQAVAAAGQFVAAGSQDGKLRIWALADGKLLHTLTPSVSQ